jgi:DNA-binding SARP family transcriptional activator
MVVDQRGCAHAIPAAKQRALLASLAVRLGTVAPAFRLIEALWGHNPPPSATKTLQTYISGLRRRLGPNLIETVGDGYRLAMRPWDLDSGRFEQLIHLGGNAIHTHQAVEGRDSLVEALSLWRGEPLTDASEDPAAMAESIRLSELRRLAQEWLTDARLALGEYEGLVGDLEALVTAEPFRERRWEQLMVALYRSGRQADALRAGHRYRATLIAQTGLEPSPGMRLLEQQILQHDPGLNTMANGSPVAVGRS